MSTSKFVDFKAVKAAVTMEQVLQHYGLLEGLKRSGDSLTGPCPIHKGTNPTQFRVSLAKNCWNCFSDCNHGGNVLDFVASMEKVTVRQAALQIVDWFQISAERSTSEASATPKREMRKSQSNPAREAAPPSATLAKVEEIGSNKPLGFALQNLDSQHAYLAERGLTPETVTEFGLGFCAKGSMAGRIAIPIHTGKGELVAYAGRWPGDPPQDSPKYKLPAGFKKSAELFNLHRALRESPDSPLVVVEGFFDAILLWQHGLKKVVALMGSSMSAAQEELIRQHTNMRSQVLIMLDEDEAGRAGRDDIADRLSRFCFVKVYQFTQSGMQPDQLPADEVAQLLQ